jgi:hypothetical protein
MFLTSRQDQQKSRLKLSMGSSIDRVKAPRFDRSASWAMFCYQFEVMAGHKQLGIPSKAIHLLATMEGRASVLHGIPTEAKYEALESHYRDHHLAAVHPSWLKAGTQLSEPLQ